MVQTNFNASDGTSLATVLLNIGSGADSAVNTAYTITMTQAILAANEVVSLKSGSSATLEGSFPFIINAFTVTGTLITGLNYTGTVTLDNGVLNNVSLTTNGSGTIVAGLYTGAVLGMLADAGDSVINNGTISYNGTFAAVELGGGTVQNGWNGAATALISGVSAGVLLETSGLVQNGGSIVASGSTAAAVFMGSGSVDNGQIGDTGANIAGADNGVQITAAGVVDNDGTITGTNADAVDLGSGTVTNGQIGDVTALISGGPAGNGIWIGTGLGTVNNFGTVNGGGASGAFLKAGGTVTNGASSDTEAQITGALTGVLLGTAGSLFNAGTVEADGSDATNNVIGTFLEDGGSIANSTTASLIQGLEWGAIVEGAAGTVTNLGLIQGSAASGLGVDLFAGGTVVNGLTTGAAATISGGYDGVRISAGSAGSGAVVENDGTISGGEGVDFESGPTAAAGTLTNDGLIESTSGASGYAVQFGIGSETLVLQPAGVFLGGVLGDNAPGSSTTLELAPQTQGSLSALLADGGTVTDGAGSFAFTAIGTIAVDTGASWAVTGPGTLDTIDNAGLVSVSGGPVTVTGSVTNSGEISIAGATLTAATGVVTDTGIISVAAGSGMKILGAGITAAGTSDLQVGGGTSAALNVTGAGATVSSAFGIGIGSTGQGSGLIDQGATVFAATPFAGDDAIYTGGSAGATGALTISDPGSELKATGQFSVGLGGDGSLFVENQATVITGGNAVDASEGVDIGQLAGATGQATVTGNTSLLTNIGRFVVGDSGLGSLAIDAGGTVTTTPGAVAGLAGFVVGNAASSAGSTVNVTGAGSKLTVAGLLDVGVDGSGALELSGGATVTAGTLDAGNVAAAVGQVSLSGSGTELSVTNSATVADDGTGILSVLSGATFAATTLTIGDTGNSSGALVVSGAGSVVQLSGALNIGTALGTGDLTVGPNGAVHAGVVNLQGQAVIEGGVLDPTVQLIGQGQTAGGYGTISAGDIIDEGVIQAGQSKASQRRLLVQGTVVGGGTLTINGTVQPSKPAGVLQINAGGTMELTGAVLNAPTTTFTDNLTPADTYTVTNSVMDVNFGDAAGVLKLDDIAGFAGTIATDQIGDSFVITGGTLSGLTVSNGNTLQFSDSGAGAGPGGIDQIIFASPVSASGFNIVNNDTVQVSCFAEGTRISTPVGPVLVENLRVGDRVITEEDASDRGSVVWIGQRAVNCAMHPKPETVWPVRVSAGALGENRPERDLHLSPDHAVFLDNALVPVKLLINGSSIVQLKRDRVRYFHVELPRHAVIFAEGLPVESYLDTGDRQDLEPNGTTIRLFPDFASRLGSDATHAWETHGAAPLVMTGERLEAARRMVVAKPQNRLRETIGARPAS